MVILLKRKKTISLLNNYNHYYLIEQRLNIITFITVFIFLVMVIKLITLQIVKNNEYQQKLAAVTLKLIEGPSVPRGRIYDRNYNLLVDNVGYKTIYYQKPKGVKVDQEISLAYKVANIIELPYHKLKLDDLKAFWLLLNKQKGIEKITNEEYKLYKERKLKNSDIYNLKIERVTTNDLSVFNEEDKKAAYLYRLMNKGYYYDEKMIKDEDVKEEEYAYLAENSHLYPGFNTKLEWERNYLYGDVLRGILGSISNTEQGIPYELKDFYLKRGYALNDRVGLSYLEYQYEDLLKGKKAIYQLNPDNSLSLVEAGLRGHDLVLSIDINLQMEVEKIIEEEMIKAKKTANTDYYNKSFVLIGEPETGSILAYASKQIIYKEGTYKIYDYTPYIATSSMALGSVVKGASMTVGYNSGALELGSKMLDECIKIKNMPPKCSWRSGLGVLDDISALRMSSNVYQFKIALKVAKGEYRYNQPITIDNEAFDIYRDIFSQFGLGTKTKIDLPNEVAGYKGTKKDVGLLMNYAIGQYDNFTSLQLLQYINTIANGGKRLKLNLLKEVHQPTKDEALGPLLYQIEPTVLNKVKIEAKYLKQIQKGFYEVMRGALGYGYMGNVPDSAGKTGTSESFLDTDNDGVIDKETITKTFAGYYPSSNPIMSIISISPDVSHRYHRSIFTSNVNKHITARVCDKFFELFNNF